MQRNGSRIQNDTLILKLNGEFYMFRVKPHRAWQKAELFLDLIPAWETQELAKLKTSLHTQYMLMTEYTATKMSELQIFRTRGMDSRNLQSERGGIRMYMLQDCILCRTLINTKLICSDRKWGEDLWLKIGSMTTVCMENLGGL